MLEINFLQQDNETFINQPAKFSLTQLTNGNLILSDFAEHYRLQNILSDWKKTHSKIDNPEDKYNQFLITNKKIYHSKYDNNVSWYNLPSEGDLNCRLESFALESEALRDSDVMLEIKNNTQQFLNDEKFNKNKVKFPDGDRIFIGRNGGYLLEYSMDEKEIVYNFGKILDQGISSLATTFDNKTLFVCDYQCGFREFDIATHNQTKNFEVRKAACCVVTYDNQFLITAEYEKKCNLIKWSIQTKQELHTWNSDVDECVRSQNCSYDNKYQFIGYVNGYLGIFDIKKHQTITNIQPLSGTICGSIDSVVFTQDNQSAYISGWDGNIKMINWKPNATSEYDFDFTQSPIKVGTDVTFEICLTKDDKNLLVGSNKLVSVFNTETRKVTQKIHLTSYIRGIKLIKDGESVLIAEENGIMSIIDLKTMEITANQKANPEGIFFRKIAVI